MNRRLLVALVLALVLPLAQLAAAAHEVSHVRALADKSAPVSAHCDLCVVAAAVTGGGAASTTPPVLAHAPVHAPAPTWAEPAPRPAERVAIFLSRAPPFPR